MLLIFQDVESEEGNVLVRNSDSAYPIITPVVLFQRRITELELKK